MQVVIQLGFGLNSDSYFRTQNGDVKGYFVRYSKLHLMGLELHVVGFMPLSDIIPNVRVDGSSDFRSNSRSFNI